MHYYSFHVGDYRKDTGHLTHEEHYIYRALIDIYYESERPLTLDKRRLLRLLSCTSDQMDTLDNVLDDFFIETEKGYFHPRIQQEIEKIYEKSEKARQSVNKRWAKHTNVSKNDTNVIRTYNERNTNDILPNTHNPLTKTHNSKENGAKRLFLTKDNDQMKDFAIRNGFSKPRSGEGWDAYRNRLQGEIDKRNRENGFE